MLDVNLLGTNHSEQALRSNCHTSTVTTSAVNSFLHMHARTCTPKADMTSTVAVYLWLNINASMRPSQVLFEDVDESDCIVVPAKQMKFDEVATAYTAFEIDAQDPASEFECKLDFAVKDCDPDTGDVDEESYPDTYALEDIDISLADFMQPVDKVSWHYLLCAWESSRGHCIREGACQCTIATRFCLLDILLSCGLSETGLLCWLLSGRGLVRRGC